MSKERPSEYRWPSPAHRPMNPEYVPEGKLPPLLLADLLKWHGTTREEVLCGPGIGEDAAVIRWPEGAYLVASSDPIVGAQKGAGHLLVAVNANDIACKGGDPRYFLVTLIIPHHNGLERARAIMAEIDESCRRIGVAVVGGHTEITSRYAQPVIVGTMMGPSQYSYDAGQTNQGDVVLMTKHAGLEGMAILAGDRPDLLSLLTEQELKTVIKWKERLSIIPEAALIRDLAVVMHDPTEGGLVGGMEELSQACGRVIQINEQQVPVSPLTRKAARELNFDPFRLISSGVLLAVVPQRYRDEALQRLEKAGINAAVVGVMGDKLDTSKDTPDGCKDTPDGRKDTLDGRKDIAGAVAEELWRLLELPQL